MNKFLVIFKMQAQGAEKLDGTEIGIKTIETKTVPFTSFALRPTTSVVLSMFGKILKKTKSR